MLATLTPAADKAPGEDRAFVDLLTSRDPGAWRMLFDTFFHDIYAFAYARTGDVHQAEDIASEVFCEAAVGIERFEYKGIPVSAWLFRIARNLTADHLQRRRRQASLSLEANAWLQEIVGEDVTEWESWRDLRGALAGLKPEHQEVLILRFIQGMHIAEVASITGKSVGAVKLLQRRATASLRRRLEKVRP